MEVVMKKKIALGFVLLFAGYVGLFAACSDNTGQDRQAYRSDNYQETIVGTISKVDTQFILMNEENDYLISGMDLSSMVGKTVELTGVVTEKEGVFTIEVSSQKEVEFGES